MALPTTKRGSSFKRRLPGATALLRLQEVVQTSREATDYAVRQFQAILKEIGGPVEKKFKNLFQGFQQNVHLQKEGRGDPWSGNFVDSTNFQHLQKNIGDKAAELIKTKLKSFTMGFALSKLAE